MSEFGNLLRRRRLEAGLSQESLAERASISVDAISAYERGLRSFPYRATVASLVEALQLSADARAEFERTTDRKRDRASRSSNEIAHNLPWQPTSFVGRNREIHEISTLLAPRRVVTITGSGGIGKTRTAIEVASRLAQPPRDGIFFVDLGPVTEDHIALRKLASVLHLRIADGDLLDELVSAIKTRDLLLILDNCEHLLAPVRAIVAAILRTCPSIALLATSRERLGIAAERTFRMPTLPVPAPGADDRSFDALELFVDRAATSGFNLAFTDENIAIATDICRRLDGIALAIELAASRLPTLGLAELREQLAQHFGVLGGGFHDLPDRQQTMTATISWSYALLGQSERVLFRRLATFANGWTLEATENVCADTNLSKASVLETLISLVEQSLVVVDLDATPPRYSFFESTRAFALDHLNASGERATLGRRHGEWSATLADRAYEQYFETPRHQWKTSLEPELDNTLAALEWACGEDGDIVLGARISSGFQGFWQAAGLAASGARYVRAGLERLDETEHPRLVARLLASQVRTLHGRTIERSMMRAIDLLERCDDPRELARCHSLLSHAFAQRGKFREAEEAIEKALAILHHVNPTPSLQRAAILGEVSQLQQLRGAFDDARDTLTEAIAIAATFSDDWSLSIFQVNLADIEFHAGNTHRAAALGTAALTSTRAVTGAQSMYALCNLACYQLVLGELPSAEASAREALALARASNDTTILHIAIQHLAAVAALRGHSSRAVSLVAWVDAWYVRNDSPREATEKKSYDILMTALSGQLQEEELTVLTLRGKQFSEDAAIAEALAPATCQASLR